MQNCIIDVLFYFIARTAVMDLCLQSSGNIPAIEGLTRELASFTQGVPVNQFSHEEVVGAERTKRGLMTIAFSQAISARHFDAAIAADVTFVRTFINDKAKLAGIVFTWVL
ncbi:hypothetical protein AD948_13425 [Acetobacter senegalensis]|uniref:Uncharacterized protein n=1 Tax=Acetobacter senegalensis TaxID=446692 RepID=A0A149TXA5_9PROT|nr:hypothetical protein [Acetobacter senegalensis]KXV57762.1 hypothetical protein AD948_13425 [Acetobacter senegalensis]